MNSFGFTENTLLWLQTILYDRFGHRFQLFLKTSEVLILQLPAQNGMICFDSLIPDFFNEKSDFLCALWNPEEENFNSILKMPLPAPGIKNLPSPLIEKKNDEYAIHYDILGLVYWMLSRKEEVGRTDLDKHGRFPTTSSHAYKHGYLDRPIVDEWLDILGQVVLRQWPVLTLKRHQSQIFVTCDVDYPYIPHSSSFFSTISIASAHLLKDKSLSKAVNSLSLYIKAKQGIYNTDPFLNAIDWIMHVNEQAGNHVVFNFITAQCHPSYDTLYLIDEKIIRLLIQKIAKRGHEVGLHTSYTTFLDKEQTKYEAQILRKVMNEEGIKNQNSLGSRQHYLRWKTPNTALNLNEAGITYDSSLSYADRSGFRCGTCHEFQMFDPVAGLALSLRQRPLILMECSVINKKYMGMGYSEEAMQYMQVLKQRCYKVGGVFTLLWHNSHFNTDQDKNFYKALIT